MLTNNFGNVTDNWILPIFSRHLKCLECKEKLTKVWLKIFVIRWEVFLGANESRDIVWACFCFINWLAMTVFWKIFGLMHQGTRNNNKHRSGIRIALWSAHFTSTESMKITINSLSWFITNSSANNFLQLLQFNWKTISLRFVREKHAVHATIYYLSDCMLLPF